jgi:tRNA (guanine37-N1)-methyltransferase
MRIDVVTLFPEPFRLSVGYGVVGRAIESGLLDLHCWNPRDETEDRRGTVDDRPFGGGPGMVMKVEPLRRTIDQARAADDRPARVGYLSPQGRRLDQRAVQELAARPRMILVCGRYEGIDERLIDQVVDEEWSIGDYVLSGGEPAAAVLVDAVTRMLPGTLGKGESAEQDSFMDGLLDCPHYTRPETLAGESIPPVLMTGDHAQIARWRLKQALGRTWLRRPDLLAARQLNLDEQALLREFIKDYRAESKDSSAKE